MVTFTAEGVERLKERCDLAAVITERGVKLQKKGKGLVARCPFHEEKTASFTVTPSERLFHCFGCGAAGDVVKFVTLFDKVKFPEAVRILCRRAGLDENDVAEGQARAARPARAADAPAAARETPLPPVPPEVVMHYHRTFCERKDAQDYLAGRGLRDLDLLRALRIGYADGSLLKMVPKKGELRDRLLELGIVTAEGRELLGGCVVVPLPDPVTSQWASLYGRGVRTDRHCYLPGPLRGVVNFHAARLSDEVVLAESILDALSFQQAGVGIAIPLYGASGLTPDHVDLLKREGVRRVIVALDNDDAGQRGAEVLRERLTTLGLAVRTATLPAGIKDANELLVSRNGDAGEAFRALLDDATPKPVSAAIAERAPAASAPPTSPLRDNSAASNTVQRAEGGELVLHQGEVVYRAKAFPPLLGRLRATVRIEKRARVHVDTLDLYAGRSRSELCRRAGKALDLDEAAIERALVALLVEAEKTTGDDQAAAPSAVEAMSTSERAAALAFLRRSDLLTAVLADMEQLGSVGEETNKLLLYLVAVSRKLDDPLSALILSQSGAGKSGLTEVVERLCPPEDVVLFTRLTPQSLYYTEPGFLDHKLVIVEERNGSAEADYSIRVLQSRKKLIVAAPVKDPQTGNMRTKVFAVEARAAFVEATTANAVNHENATRCFELAMDESEAQTRRIHERQRLMRTEQGLVLRQQADEVLRRHWNAQRLLESAPVVIPYADKLTFPASWMRTRRDHARFLNLIEVSAFLHQHQRERKGGAIVATVDDYAVAHRLAGQVLVDTLGDLKRNLREAFEQVRALAEKSSGAVSRREIREALSLPDSTVRRWLTELVELEYLEVEASRGGAGLSARYRVSERGPQRDLALGLLSVDELREKL